MYGRVVPGAVRLWSRLLLTDLGSRHYVAGHLRTILQVAPVVSGCKPRKKINEDLMVSSLCGVDPVDGKTIK